jgi:hypothetical protein
MNKREIILFSKKLAVFLAISLALLLILNLIYLKCIISKTAESKNQKNYYGYINSLQEKEIKYAFFGDSQVQFLDPHYINDSFNFAFGGGNYIKTYFKLNDILNNQGVKIDYALIQIDPSSFSSSTNKPSFFAGNSLREYYKIMPLDLISKIIKKSKFSLVVDYYLPVIGHGHHFSFLIANSGEDYYHGWQKSPSGNFSKQNKTQVSIEEYWRLMDTDNNKMDPLLVEYFSKIINLSNEKNVTLIFVRYPLSKEYWDVLEEQDSMSSEEYYKEVFNIINNDSGKHYILDYHDYFFNNSDYLGDPHHVTDAGGDILSKVIAQELRKID